MAFKNVMPAWFILLHIKQRKLSPEELREWLLSDEAKIIPEAVRLRQLSFLDLEINNPLKSREV
jgi:hypothetical protein